MLVQQKFQQQYIDYQTKAWLANQLQQYEAYGEQQEKMMKRSRESALAERFFMSLGEEVKPLAFPSQEFIRRGAPAAETYGVPLPAPSPTYPEEEATFQQALVDLARSFREGTAPTDDTQKAVARVVGADATIKYMYEFGKEAGERADRLLRGRELDIEERKLPTEWLKATTGAGRLGFEMGEARVKPAETERKEWLEFVKDIEDHLRQEGVEKSDIDKQDTALFGSGKIPDPLSAINRGKAYTYLGEIRSKLIQNQRLTAGEIRFLQTVRNSWQIAKPPEMGGGLVSPELGGTALEVQNRMVEEVARLIQQKTGLDPEQARRLALEFVGLLK